MRAGADVGDCVGEIVRDVVVCAGSGEAELLEVLGAEVPIAGGGDGAPAVVVARVSGTVVDVNVPGVLVAPSTGAAVGDGGSAVSVSSSDSSCSSSLRLSTPDSMPESPLESDSASRSASRPSAAPSVDPTPPG